MKKLLVIMMSILIAGCAAFKGQMKYAGIGSEPAIHEYIVKLPEMQRMTAAQKKEDGKIKEMMLRDYWTTPVNKVAVVDNPLDSAISVDVHCDCSFPSDASFVVPAHTSQEMLFTTNATYMYEKLCRIVNYSVVK